MAITDTESLKLYGYLFKSTGFPPFPKEFAPPTSQPNKLIDLNIGIL